MPGFTAEASLYNSEARYRATTEAAVYGGLVQPASPSDRIDQYRPVLSRNHDFASDVFCYWRFLCHWENLAFDPVYGKPLLRRVCGWEHICWSA